jgi:hypothetical protein
MALKSHGPRLFKELVFLYIEIVPARWLPGLVRGGGVTLVRYSMFEPTACGILSLGGGAYTSTL